MSPASPLKSAMLPSSPPSSDVPTSSHRDLRALPLEILDNIGYFAALAANPSSSSTNTSYAAPPPQALRYLLLTCRHVNDHLSASVNPRLYARIFRARFDLDPIARRYGRKAITVENLAGELRRRCVVLKRIKRAVELGQLRPEGETEEGEIELRENMWLAYLMMTENDGNNLEALLWAGIRSYLSLHHTQEMLRSALQPGYPPESEDRALAMHLSHLLSDASLLATESKEDADEKLFVLRPYVFASHKFNGFYAPWPLRNLPIGAGPPSAIAEGVATAPGQTLLERNRGAPVPMPSAAEVQSAPATARAPPAAQANPFLADHTPEDRSTTIRHVGQTLSIRPPCIVHAAYHLFFGQVERNPGLVGLTAITRRGAPPGSEPAGATNGNSGNPAPQPAAPAAGPPQQVHADPMRLKSTDHDRDVMRLLRCHSPTRGPGLKPCFFAGIVDGAWEGRFSFFCFDSYREMLAGRMRSLYEGPFGEQPQVWKLREHFLRVDESGTGNGKTEGGLGSMVNAGFPVEEPFEETMALPGSIEELHEREREVVGSSGKRRGSASTHSDTKREPPAPGSLRAQAGRQPIPMMMSDKYSDVLRHVQKDEVLPPDLLGLYPQFSEEDGGPEAGYGYLPSPPRSRSHLLAHKGDDDEDAEVDGGRYEMLVSGSGHSAWGSFVLRGRIRAWDGMLILSKEYRPDGRGRWLYRGYITAGGCLIGRWRDSFTPGDMSGYEGPFVLNRRSTGGEEV